MEKGNTQIQDNQFVRHVWLGATVIVKLQLKQAWTQPSFVQLESIVEQDWQMSMIPLIARKHITVLKVTDDYYFLSIFYLD